MKWIHYGYYIVLPNGIPATSGDDWGPTEDSYKIGSVLGTRNGKAGVVVGILKGTAAKRQGFDVVVLVEERAISAPSSAPLPQETIESAMRVFTADPALPSPPVTIQSPWVEKSVRMVAIWNKVYPRPLTETFHEFLIEVPLKGTLTAEWHEAELEKAENARHIIERWLRAFYEEGRRNRPADHKPGVVYGALATGATTELIALAHDLYILQKVNRLPDRLIERLRNHNEFQGARYEVAIGAAFVKCGFEIEWIDNRTRPHPEFIGRNVRTGEELAVETKSRHRPGTIHQTGDPIPVAELRADVDRLYREALQQNTTSFPFAVFLDFNLPSHTQPDQAAAWQQEVVRRWPPSEELALLGFTNFAWHYRGDDRTPSAGPEFLLSVPISSAHPLRSHDTLRSLKLVLDHYGICPNEY